MNLLITKRKSNAFGVNLLIHILVRWFHEGVFRGRCMADVKPLLKEDGEPYKVAVLIPTINNADELDIVLERLSKQTYPDFEIVISDSKSKDHTKQVCEKYGATWIDDPSRNRANACNFALEQMDHDLVLFTDDDTIPPLDWVEKLVRWFEDPEVGAVGGPNLHRMKTRSNKVCRRCILHQIHDRWNKIRSTAKRKVGPYHTQSRS